MSSWPRHASDGLFYPCEICGSLFIITTQHSDYYLKKNFWLITCLLSASVSAKERTEQLKGGKGLSYNYTPAPLVKTKAYWWGWVFISLLAYFDNNANFSGKWLPLFLKKGQC